MTMLFDHAANALYSLIRTRNYLLILPIAERAKLEVHTRYSTDNWQVDLSGAVAALERGSWPGEGSRLAAVLRRWEAICGVYPVPALNKDYPRDTHDICVLGVRMMLKNCDQRPNEDNSADWEF